MHTFNLQFKIEMVSTFFYFQLRCITPCMSMFWHKVVYCHTLSTAFRHLPPNSARFSYATEGALFISVQLSSDAVRAL